MDIHAAIAFILDDYEDYLYGNGSEGYCLGNDSSPTNLEALSLIRQWLTDAAKQPKTQLPIPVDEIRRRHNHAPVSLANPKYPIMQSIADTVAVGKWLASLERT